MFTAVQAAYETPIELTMRISVFTAVQAAYEESTRIR